MLPNWHGTGANTTAIATCNPPSPLSNNDANLKTIPTPHAVQPQYGRTQLRQPQIALANLSYSTANVKCCSLPTTEQNEFKFQQQQQQQLPAVICVKNCNNNQNGNQHLGPQLALCEQQYTCNSAANGSMSGEGEKVEQMSRLTKWLCAIILALVLVVLLLILMEAPQRWGSGQRDVLIPAATTTTTTTTTKRQKLNSNSNSSLASLSERRGPAQQQAKGAGEQGKLLASGSDEHYTQLDGPSEHHHDDTLDEQDPEPNGAQQRAGGQQAASRDSNELARGEEEEEEEEEGRRAGNRLQGNSHRGAHKVHRDPGPASVCMSAGCVRAAAQVLNNMDNSVKPCDDFYQFACGRWISSQVIPDEKSSLSVFSQNTADLNLKLRALIERAARAEDPPIVGQMRNMYASCMNLSDIEARGDQPLEETLRFFGGWPVLAARSSPTTTSLEAGETPARAQGSRRRRRRQNNGRAAAAAVVAEEESPANWLELLIKFRQRGFSHDMIIDLSVVPDVRNNKRYIIELDQSSLGLPDRAYYFKGMNDTTVSAYYNLMVESAVLLGAPRAEARKQMLEALEFESALARISAPREQRRNVTRMYNKMVARDLYKLAPNIDWLRYLRALLKEPRIELDEDEVIVKVPAFLQALDALLLKSDQRTVTNYMIWRIVRHSMGGLSRKWRELAHSYSAVTTGRQAEEPRWEQCLGSLDGTLGTALSALYVKNHFDEKSKAAALQMVDYIRAEFLRMLAEVDWMDEETREEARSKAKAISAYIGYPDELLQDSLVEELYGGVQMARTNFYQNMRNLRVWSTDYAFAQLRKPNKRGDWKKHARAAVVNAYYNSLENSIEFPAGILQGAFFDADRPNYMNFGAIGYVIGHEITHGFDDRGRQFDRDGNDRNWWKPKTDARYRERAQCIIDQYANYTVAENGLRVNGLNTQGENIADNGGIKEAFRAYRRWTKDHGREQRLPGLADYTPDQLFWMSAANIWCGKFRPEVLKLRLNSGVHSPARFRIIGPLSNSAEFAQSFGCPLGSPMNPQKKCSVW